MYAEVKRKKDIYALLMRRVFWLLVVLMCMLSSLVSSAQDLTTLTIKLKRNFLDYPTSLDKKRLIGVSVGGIGTYSAIMAGVGTAWYGKDKLTKFHWFEDSHEWNQIDKTGHFFAPYFITTWSYNMLRWSGMKNTPAALTAGAFAFISISAFEIPDGLHPKYGASWSDLVFNFGGAALATTQYLIWKEQRISVKYSFHIINYPRGELRDRADNLYGKSFGERILKDYNGVTMWLSFNLHSFNHKIKPSWLNVAVGYAAGNLYGGFENKWTDKNGMFHDRRDIKRYRRFFISIDADYTKFKTRTKAGKMVLGILNIVKLPMPAIEFNTLGQVVFHPMYFLNLDVPLYLKK
jgi:hypothetical protein